MVEAITAAIFVAYYALFYLTPPEWHLGFCAPSEEARSFVNTWPHFLLYLYLLAALLAASACTCAVVNRGGASIMMRS